MLCEAACTGPDRKPDPSPVPSSGDVQITENEELEGYNTGIYAYQDQDYLRARTELEKWLKTHEAPPADHALLILGKIAMLEQRDDDAMERFEEVVRSYPDSKHAKIAEKKLRILERQRQKDHEKEFPAPIAASSAPTEELERFMVLVEQEREEEGAKRDIAREKLLDTVDNRLSRTELYQLTLDLPEDSYALRLVLLKSALLERHLGHRPRSREAAQRLVKLFPSTDEAQRGQSILDEETGLEKVAPLTVGVLLPLSGSAQAIGEKARAAMDMALEEWKPTFQDALKVVYKDTASDPQKAVQAIRELVFEEHAIAAIGPLQSTSSKEAAFEAEKLGLPLVTLSRLEELPKIGPHVLRVGLTYRQQVQALVEYTWTMLGLKKYAIFYPKHPYGEEMANEFWDEIERRGGEITAIGRYNQGDTVFATSIRKMVGTYYHPPKRAEKRHEVRWQTVDFEALFVPDYYRAITKIAPSLEYEDIHLFNNSIRLRRQIDQRVAIGLKPDVVRLLGANGWNHPKLGQQGGKYVGNSIFVDGFDARDETSEKRRNFVTRFEMIHKRLPGTTEAYAYDALVFVLSTLSEHQPQGRQPLLAAMVQTSDFEGVTGHFHFDAFGEIVQQPFLLTVKDNEIVPAVGPEEEKSEGESESGEEEAKTEPEERSQVQEPPSDAAENDFIPE